MDIRERLYNALMQESSGGAVARPRRRRAAPLLRTVGGARRAPARPRAVATRRAPARAPARRRLTAGQEAWQSFLRDFRSRHPNQSPQQQMVNAGAAWRRQARPRRTGGARSGGARSGGARSGGVLADNYYDYDYAL